MADSADSEYRDLKLDVKEEVKRGIHAIKRLPITRRARQVTPPPILRDLLDLLQGYLASPSHYAPPLKSLLFDAVISLLPKGRKNLSTQWSKMHLCLALKKWVLSTFAAWEGLAICTWNTCDLYMAYLRFVHGILAICNWHTCDLYLAYLRFSHMAYLRYVRIWSYLRSILAILLCILAI